MPASPACSSRMNAQELRARVVLVDDRVADVRAVEARHEDPRVVEREALDDLGARLRIGGGGERDARHVREALVQQRKLQVLGPEVVAPLRDAVRLVDREQRDRRRCRAARGNAAWSGARARRRAGRARRPAARVRRCATHSRPASELRNAARTPACVSAATWSCISAMSGDTTTPVPSRSSAGIW